MNKRGFFFILDTVVAVALLIVGTILIYGSQSSASPTVQASFIAADILNQLSTTPVKSVSSDYFLALRFNNTIMPEDFDRSVLEMITILQNQSNNQSASGLVNVMINDSVSPNYNFLVYVDDVLIFNRTNKPSSQAQSIIVYRQLVTTIKNQTLIGPVVAKVSVW